MMDTRLASALALNDYHYFRHTYYVVLAWKLIRDELIKNKIINESELEKINTLIAWHDNSKISSEKRTYYAKKFYYDAGEEEKEQIKSDFKEAVNHHKMNNLHHYESLREYTGDDWKCYVIELICDYIAMGWEFKNYVFEYYESVREKIDLNMEYKGYLEYVLNILKCSSVSDSLSNPLTRELEKSIVNKD